MIVKSFFNFLIPVQFLNFWCKTDRTWEYIREYLSSIISNVVAGISYTAVIMLSCTWSIHQTAVPAVPQVPGGVVSHVHKTRMDFKHSCRIMGRPENQSMTNATPPTPRASWKNILRSSIFARPFFWKALLAFLDPTWQIFAQNEFYEF